MDKKDAPAIACCSARMDFHGAAMSRTWVDLGADAKPGDQQVVLSQEVTGWSVGDEVIVTGTKRTFYDHGVPRNEPKAVTTESRRVTKIDGNTIELDQPLVNEHAGSGDYRSEVANLSRNVIIESADPAGVRGHTIYHTYSQGSISHARFAHLGKEGVLGRYSIHFHLVGNTMRGSSVVGAAIVDSHNRWITIHGTNHMVVRDCVGYKSVGHGFFLEDGTEVYNVLDRNLGVQAYGGAKLPDQVLPFDPNDGGAFWWANGRNTIVRNTACENNKYGYRYDSQRRSNFDSTLAVMMPDGKEREVDIRTIPFYRFEDNETHTEGLYGVAISGTDLASPDKRHPHIVKNLTIWNVHYALRPHVPKMWIENLKINHATYGIYRPELDHHVYRNIYLTRLSARALGRAGGADGHGAGTPAIQHGPFSYENVMLENIRTHDPLICLNTMSPSHPQEGHFRNIVFKEATSQSQVVDDMVPATTPLKLQQPISYYFHDFPNKGETSKVVSIKFPEQMKDGKYDSLEGFTGTNARIASVSNVEFPQVLNPVDDLPPATTVTYPPAGASLKLTDGTLIVRGTTTDNVKTSRVIINGVAAQDVDYNFHQWSARLTGIKPGSLTITATAEDAAGNVEQTPHTFKVSVK
ncbi:MAG: hypothetical protein ACI9G1_002625 [Pirellulaceae bacterium]|jgi:hypothetical protein